MLYFQSVFAANYKKTALQKANGQSVDAILTKAVLLFVTRSVEKQDANAATAGPSVPTVYDYNHLNTLVLDFSLFPGKQNYKNH